MSALPDKSATGRRRARSGDPLTGRELQILALVAAGEPTAEISRRLGVAENTIKTHLTNIYRKTGCRNRVQAVRHYLDTYASTPPEQSAPTSSPPPTGATPLIERQIQEIQARLDDLAEAAAEAERLKRALEALRSIERS